MITLAWIVLGGAILSPNQQDISTAARIAEQFLAQTTDRLIIIIVALFVIFLILGALVTLVLIRNMGGRDKTTSTVVMQLSQIISQQSKTIEQHDQLIAQRDVEYRALFVQIADRNEKADQRSLKMLEQNTETQLRHAMAVEALVNSSNALASNANTSADLLIKHDKRAETGINDILNAISELQKRFTDFEHKFDTRFPPGVEFKSEFEELRQSLNEVAKRCKEVKRETDEHPALPLYPPETEADLSPGADAQESEAA